MKDFIAAGDRALLERHGLADFDALWALQLVAVDAPNTGRGGWSSVYRLELEEACYYLKRQSNYLTRSLRRPCGEPTFARELRTIRQYQRLGIPALQAAFFAQRQIDGEPCAVLLTRALDDWQDLDTLLEGWAERPPGQRQAIVRACGELARTLHGAGQLHGCFYPKHIFLREQDERWRACLIDLEKTRPLRLGRYDRIKDLEPLLRRASAWSDDEVQLLLATYLGDAEDLQAWLRRLSRRRQAKAVRR
ncbi:MAG: lipopolysaccharide kinase InaA family protein [Pseudomonas sp.]|uniref:lipopolysaccharide kinase InaA family protein n=1 Tax=Pseudomonas sp. TaxID=306 RepID=UPI003394E1A2